MGMQQQPLRAGRLLESAGPCSAIQGCLLGAHCAAPAFTVLQSCLEVVGPPDGAQKQQKEGSFLCTLC